MSVNRRQKERQEARRASARAWAEKQESGFEPRTVQLPDGTSWFSTKEKGNYEIDIIPYVAGPGNPSADEGMVHFERTYYVHRGLGLDGKDSYCCLAKTFGRPCPVCDHIRKQADQEMEKTLRVSQRCLWRVIDHKNPKKGIQAWDTSYWKGFGELLANKLKASNRYDNFCDLQGGRTVEVTIGKLQGPVGSYNGPTNIEMVEREEDYPDSLIDEGFNPDLCIIPPRPKHLKDKPITDYTKADWKVVYDHYKAIMWGDTPDEDEEGSAVATTDDDDDAPPAKKPAAKRPAADDDDEEPAPKKPAARKPAPVEEDEDEAPPTRKPAARKPAPADDLDDEDEDEAPPAKKPAARKPAPVEEDDDEPAPKKPAAKRPAADDEDEAPARNGTAGKAKYKAGDWVIYNDQPHVITAINAATGVITIEDDDGEDYRVKPEKLTPCPKPSGR